MPNSRERSSEAGSGSPRSIPRILDVSSSLVRYESPKIFYVGSERREVQEAVEIVVRTDSEIPARALTPTLYVGEVGIDDFEMREPLVYVFYGIDVERLEDGEVISFGWRDLPERRTTTRFRFRLGAPPVA